MIKQTVFRLDNNDPRKTFTTSQDQKISVIILQKNIVHVFEREVKLTVKNSGDSRMPKNE